ncbi:MAG: hypothetical protein P8P74_13480 [Crocinitomicaceae bacterium]|nr:hypothetical protein [Crocinitomicaceae bacterium]
MKSLLLFLFIAPAFVFAQKHKDNQAKYYLNRLQHFGRDIETVDFNHFAGEITSEQLKDNGVRSVTVQRGRSGKSKTFVRYALNDRGLIDKIEHPKDTISYSYIQDSLVETVKITGKTEKVFEYEYQNGFLKKKEVFEKNRLSSRLFLDYSEDQKVSFSLLQSGRKLKTSYSMNYEYENGKVRRQQFIKNDRIVRTWDYSCEPKGQRVDEKTTSTLCKVVEENNDGSYVVHIRKVENGEVLLYSHSYTKDSVNYASACEKETGELVWTTEKQGKTRTSKNYDSKGKLRSQSVVVYDESDRLVETTYTFGKKQKRTSVMKYTYNDEGLLASKTSFYKGEESYFRNYIYE